MTDIQTTPGDADTPDVSVAPAPGSAEARAASVAASVDRQAAVEGGKPADLPEKFWDAANNRVNIDALIKSYTEAERALHNRGPKPDAPATPATTPDAPAATGEKVEKLGIQAPANPAPGQLSDSDFSKYGQEITANGALSEDSYKELEAKGLPKAIVDGYVAGQMALASQARAEIFGTAGGESQYATMTKWASTGLAAEEQDWFNKAIESDMVSAKRAVEWLSSKYTAANGSAPKLLNGGASAMSGGAAPFANQREAVQMRNDPRFTKDAEFRAKYQARVKATVTRG